MHPNCTEWPLIFNQKFVANIIDKSHSFPFFSLKFQFFLKLSATRRKRLVSKNARNRISKIALIDDHEMSFRHHQHLIHDPSNDKKRVQFRFPRFQRKSIGYKKPEQLVLRKTAITEVPEEKIVPISAGNEEKAVNTKRFPNFKKMKLKIKPFSK